MEVPIRTNRNGVLLLAIVAFAAIVTFMGDTAVASAQTKSSVAVSSKGTKTTVKKSASKGVRTKSANQPLKSGRRSGVARAKAAPVTVALPAEVSGENVPTDAIERAKQLVAQKTRYRYGGTDPKTGLDCTGLVINAYGDKARSLGRSSGDMFASIAKTSELQPGDIVFFGRGRVRHAAIYVGGGTVVHASTPSRGVRTDSLQTLARALGYVGAGRI